MTVFVFNTTPNSPIPCNIAVSADDEEAARKQVAEIRRVEVEDDNSVLVDSLSGTLEDYLGSETINRIEHLRTRYLPGDPPKRQAAIAKAAEK